MEPLATTVVGVILTALLSVLTTVCLMAWKSLRTESRSTRAYIYNFMSLQFQLLKRLNPDKTDIILEEMLRFSEKNKSNKSNGQRYEGFQ